MNYIIGPIWSLTLIFLMSITLVHAQSFEDYERHTLTNEELDLPYRLLPPKNIAPGTQYPLILFLHGSGERGSDNELQLTHGATFFLQDSIRENYPAYVLFPQCQSEMSWNSSEYILINGIRDYSFPTKHEDNLHLDLVEALLDKMLKDYPIDKMRIYVGGLSMGGMGTFELVSRNPRRFAAAFAICGGAHPRIARRIQRTSWWIFHGEQDDVVPLNASVQIYDALIKKNADVRLTKYPEVKHDSWNNAFAEPELMPWLFSKQRLKK